MSKGKIEGLLAEYIALWKERELVFTLTPEMGWDAYSNMSKSIHGKIGDFFEKISLLNSQERKEIFNKLKETTSEIVQEENLFKRILEHFKEDHSGGRKYLMNVAISTRTALTNEVTKIEYDLRKEAEGCNCLLKQELRLHINYQPAESIEKIKDFTDGYYEFELHRCSRCNTFWINDINSDDGPAKGWREAQDTFELKLIETYNNQQE